jgi:hypothetical protein
MYTLGIFFFFYINKDKNTNNESTLNFKLAEKLQRLSMQQCVFITVPPPKFSVLLSQ